MANYPFIAASMDELFRTFGSSQEGITEASAAARIKAQAGSFKKESRAKREVRLLIRQFANPLQVLLIVAVLLSFFLGDNSDALIIMVILLFTAVLSFFQEANAGRAVEKIRRLIAIKHTVLRGSRSMLQGAHEIVPGDVLILDAGDIIPADCRIIESNELHINESALTGESYPVEKSPGTFAEDTPLNQCFNCLWQGTNVISGTAKAIVVQTGSQTVFGKMTQSLVQTTETAFEKGLRRFGMFLLRITILLSLFILIINLYFKKPFFDSVLFSLALAVGMAPELLPAIMTLSMSASARRMMRKKVIVKKLSSVFNFGEVQVLCTDKTGTITEGNVLVKDIIDSKGNTSDQLRLFAALNATLQQGFSNPIDEAIRKMGIDTSGYAKLNEIPYDFIRKRLSVAVKKGEEQWMIVKGAFSSILPFCTAYRYGINEEQPLGEAVRNELEAYFIQKSEEGFRVLGLAAKTIAAGRITKADEQGMVFLGFILLEDPLKGSTLASLKRLEELHIDIKIITGDNRYAARHTAGLLGLQEACVLTGPEIDQLTLEALVVKARDTVIFSEIEPHQKERIIKALQRSGLAVAYIGDGINDVAAINAADIGISTNNAVDVAKEAADFVLLENDLSVLAEGVREGRLSFANSMKYILITTGATFGNMFSVAGASLFLPFLPMLPKQLLLNNLITDFPFMAISTDQVDSRQLERPGKWDIRQLRNFMWVFGLHSSLFDFLTFYLLYLHWQFRGSLFQTGWFLESAITEILILFVIRTRMPLWRSSPSRMVLYSGIFAVLIVFLLPYLNFAAALGFTPMPPLVLAQLLLIYLAYLLSADLLKRIFFKVIERGNKQRRLV